MSEENPLIKALPPETDYITYLTLLEYNLSKEQLPTLHGILQDTTLTVNIGWDLVHLLLPLLPESEECLTDLARLGNPREVILKATELLEEIAHTEDADEGAEEEEPESTAQEEGSAPQLKEDAHSVAKSPEPKAAGRPTKPSQEIRFEALLSMLTVLHPRIKTKYPSRFLSTSLQSVLSAYTSLKSSIIATEAILSFAKRLSGTKRPQLPPRQSSSSVTTLKTAQSLGSAPDPEANADGTASGELELQQRLMQSFLTYVAEVYVSGLQQVEDAPGLSYAARYNETMMPEKNVPGRHTVRELFEKEEYHIRDSTMGQLLALLRDLKLKPEELLNTILKPPEQTSEEGAAAESELPSAPSDVPLSSTGSLHLLSTLLASPTLFHNSSPSPIPLPDYTTIVNTLLSAPSSPTFGSESPAYLDAILFLGFYILNDTHSAFSLDNEALNAAIQRLSLLSAQLPSPAQRYQAHTLASQLLHLHPSAEAKVAYIKDTLEFCPYLSLKASAVGWIKDEILAAANNMPGANAKESTEGDGGAEDVGGGIFASPALFTDALGEFLWGDRVGVPLPDTSSSTTEVKTNNIREFTTLQDLLPFYLSVLNLLFLLLSNNALFESFDTKEWIESVEEDFLRQVKESAEGFDKVLESGGLDDGDDAGDGDGTGNSEFREARKAQLALLSMNVQQVSEKIKERIG